MSGLIGECGFELGQLQRGLEAQQLHAVAQYIQRVALVQLVAQAGQQGLIGFGAVVLGNRFPGLGLRGLHPSQHTGGKDSAGAVIASGITFGITASPFG